MDKVTSSPAFKKPTYRTSKKALWISSALAWLVILALVIGALMDAPQAVPMAEIAVPSLVVLIAALLGVHRGFGSLDLRAALNQPRDDPIGDLKYFATEGD